jgi:hypothetical protein
MRIECDMNPTMKNFQNSDVFQRFALFGLQATGSVVAVGIAVFWSWHGSLQVRLSIWLTGLQE